jgi:hypothetical protein
LKKSGSNLSNIAKRSGAAKLRDAFVGAAQRRATSTADRASHPRVRGS